MVKSLQFGEIYELRFQREGTNRQFRHPPRVFNPPFVPSKQFGEDSLAGYLKRNKYAANLFYDDTYRYKVSSDGTIARLALPDRWILMTNGPQDKTLTRVNQIHDDCWTESSDPAESFDFKKFIQRVRDENLFPIDIPKIIIRYTSRKPTAEEREKLEGVSVSYVTNTDRVVEAKKLMHWTNKEEVLDQIQAKRINKIV